RLPRFERDLFRRIYLEVLRLFRVLSAAISGIVETHLRAANLPDRRQIQAVVRGVVAASGDRQPRKNEMAKILSVGQLGVYRGNETHVAYLPQCRAPLDNAVAILRRDARRRHDRTDQIREP